MVCAHDLREPLHAADNMDIPSAPHDQTERLQRVNATSETEFSMSTSLTTSIKPQFLTIDGLRIRYAESGGLQEPGCCSQILADHLPNARLRIYPDAAHGSLFQYPRQFAELVTEFLSAA